MNGIGQAGWHGGGPLRRGELKIEGLGKRYSFRSTAPSIDDDDESERSMEDEGAASAGLSLLWGRRAEVWALRDVSFHVRPGERVAIIGDNGSGKSTLIRLLSRILPPSEGIVFGAGILVPFAALKKPLSQDVSGCENLRMLARLLSIPLDTLEDRLPGIVEFSEIGSFAYEKVSRYSDQLFARLGAAMAVSIDGDIFLVDDSVKPGDDNFREKFDLKLAENLRRGATLVYASNSLGQLRRLCTRAIWLRQGQVVADGAVDDILDRYSSRDQDDQSELADETQESPERPRPQDVQSATVPAERLRIDSSWQRNVKLAEQRRARKLKRWREKNKEAELSNPNVYVESDAGILGRIRRFTCFDSRGVPTSRDLPGEAVSLELLVETKSRGIKIELKLEFGCRARLLFASEPLAPLLAAEPGQFLFRVEIDGDILAYNGESDACTFCAQVRFSHPDSPEVEFAKAEIAYEVANNFVSASGQQQLMDDWQDRTMLEHQVSTLGPGAQNGNPDATASLPKARMLDDRRRPVLRPQLRWMVYHVCPPAAPEEIAGEPVLQLAAS